MGRNEPVNSDLPLCQVLGGIDDCSRWKWELAWKGAWHGNAFAGKSARGKFCRGVTGELNRCLGLRGCWSHAGQQQQRNEGKAALHAQTVPHA